MRTRTRPPRGWLFDLMHLRHLERRLRTIDFLAIANDFNNSRLVHSRCRPVTGSRSPVLLKRRQCYKLLPLGWAEQKISIVVRLGTIQTSHGHALSIAVPSFSLASPSRRGERQKARLKVEMVMSPVAICRRLREPAARSRALR